MKKNTIRISKDSVNVDHIIGTTNHFGCIDLFIDKAKAKLHKSFIKELHYVLKYASSDSRKYWFNVGAYKKLPNEVGGNETVSPKDIATKMKELLSMYHTIPKKSASYSI